MPTYEIAEKKLIQELVADVEEFMGLTARKISIKALWDESPPPDAGGQSLQAYLKDVSHSIIPGRSFG